MSTFIDNNRFITIGKISWKKDKIVSISTSEDLDTVSLCLENDDIKSLSFNEHGSDNSINSYEDFVEFIIDIFSIDTLGDENTKSEFIIKDFNEPNNKLRINPDGSIDFNNLSNLSKMNLINNISNDRTVTYTMTDLGDGVNNYTKALYTGTINGEIITATRNFSYELIDGSYYLTNTNDE